MSLRQPLLETLRAAHLRLALAALVAAAIVLTVVSFVTLRGQVEQNLTLVARSISYTAEAAAVFGDAASAQEALVQVAAKEELREALIVDVNGRTLARYEASAGSALETMATEVAALLFAQEAHAEIASQGRRL
ncbi:MAG: CHASE sensor domain-containing protein, partial [Piscinibacter sp.]